MGRKVFVLKVGKSVHRFRVIVVGVLGECNIQVNYGTSVDGEPLAKSSIERYRFRLDQVDALFAQYYVCKYLKETFKKDVDIDEVSVLEVQ